MSMDPSTIFDDLCAQLRGDLVWVMDLPHYRQIRKICWREDDDVDPETVTPDSGDRMFGYPIEVRENGGKPHIEWQVKK